jgi:hypothetical protein
MKRIYSILCLVAPLCTLPVVSWAHVVVYQLEITMEFSDGPPQATPTFSGTFMFNTDGTGFCSAAACTAGLIPDFSNLNIIDKPTFFSSYSGRFTEVSGFQGPGGGELAFVDLEGFPPPGTSSIFVLVFDTDTPLGGPSPNIGISNITWIESPNVTGIFECGPNAPTPGILICPVATLRLDTAPSALLSALKVEATGVGPGQSLTGKVSLAQTYLTTHDIGTTCSYLDSFVNEVHAQTGKKITPDVAAELIADAQAIEARLNCQAN